MKTIKDINYSFNHLNERLNERFNLSITWEEYYKLNKILKNDKSNMILIENKDQEIHQLTFKGASVTFVFNTNKNFITTSLKWYND